MKKNGLYLIIMSAVLMLVSWNTFGKVLDTQESKTVISVSNPRSEVPDYLADGKLFNDMYLQNVPSGAGLKAPD